MENISIDFAWIWLIPIVAAGAGAIYKNKEEIHKALTSFGKNLVEKKLAIIGLPKAGKTTLAEYLQNNRLPEETIPTLSPKHYECTLGDLGMQIGITDNRANITKHDYKWDKDLVLASDIILYLFDVSKLLTEKEEYFKKISKEIKIFCDTLNKVPKEEIDTAKKKIFIALGTHADMLNEDALIATDPIAGVKKDFSKIFEFDCKFACLVNSLVEGRVKGTVNEIFEKLREFYEKDKGFIDRISSAASEKIGQFFPKEVKNEHNHLGSIAKK